MPDPAAVPSDVSSMPPAPLVAIAGWLVPGAGYWLIGHRARALVVGVTIITLFLAGTLIGGVRAIQVPGYGEDGGRLYIEPGGRIREQLPGRAQPSNQWVMTDSRAVLGEIGNKPWSICQVMTGPVALLGGAASVRASRPVEVGEMRRPGEAPGVLSHSRINEIAVLYTAVAGMLNLLAMIDAAARAGYANGFYSSRAAAPAQGAT